MKTKKIISLLLALAFCLTLLPAAAGAQQGDAGYDADDGFALLSDVGESPDDDPLAELAAATVDYYDPLAPEGQRMKSQGDCARITAKTTALADGWYAAGDVSVSARIKVTGDVNIILLDYSEFDALGGIYVAEGARLTIWGQSEGTGAGKLTVPDPGELKAGIGGNDYNDKEGNSGDITINGGILDVTGGYKTAGIGGGNHGSGNITINGGRVTAKGGTFGAGIGGGNCGSGSITVTGGYVEAQGGSEGAGIGAGDEKNGGTVEISGGTVKATGGTWAAGIGGGGVAGFNPGDVDVNGPGGSGGDVTISGGDVTAQGGEYGAGIGGGYRGSGLLSGKKIEISGGSVTAKGGQRAAGIGGGNHGNGGLDGSKVVISGGDVKAYGSEKWAAGIGGGNCGDGCEVEIKGGTVEVKAGDGSAQGIGCGDEGESSGDLSLFADARVTAGDAEPGSAVIANDRRKECRKKWVKIEPCTSHEIEGGSPVCKYCGGVPYFDPIFGTERVCTNFTELKNKKTLLLTSDWYVVSGDVKVDNVYVTGHADLILCDGAKLTVNNNIELTDSIYHDLTVWGQRKGDGALVVDNLNNGSSQDHWNAGIGGVVTSDGADLSKVFSNGGLLIVNGGSIISTGGKSGGAAIGGAYMGGGGRVRINGGSITAISNSKDAENIGAGAGGDYSGFIEFDANITHAGFRAGKSVSGAADDWLWYEVNYREMACHTKGDIVRIEPCTDHSFINGVCEYCNAKGSAKAPVITKQPGDLNLTSGYTEGNKLSVTAEADTGAAYKLSYQWYSCEDENKTNAAAIDGATNAEYVVPEGKDAGTVEYYFCTVTATRTDNDESVYTKSDTAKVTVSGESQGDSPTPGAVSYYVPIAPDGQHIKSENGCTKIKPDTAELGNGWYTAGDVTVSKRIRVTGKANIILLDESELLAPLGIYVAEDASLTVWAQSTGDDAGRLTIANVGSGLAGIGGNNYKDNEGNAGEITINGGVLNVKGGENGAGIGGGNHGACKSITINGGIIASCIGGKNGAGIGGGNCGAGGTININGGEIHAQGGSRGAGIGGGDWGEGGTVNISDGKIEARGGENAAGIGGGGPNDKEGRGGGEVTVSGGVVKAYGGTRGAGIGGGEYGNGGTLTVSGSCDVEARGGSYGAGIGGGDSGNGGEVTIDGGSVSAYGNNGSAGIGGGDYGNGGKLTVNDGFVYASGSTRDTSGAVTYQAAPGIGSGRPKDNGSAPLKSGVCEIYGGVVIAQAGETTVENKRAQAIGVNIADKDKNGNNGDDRLIIGEGMTVSAGAKDPGELVEAKNRISACREYGRAKIAPCEDHEIGDEGDKCKYCGSEIDEPIPGYISTICLTENGTAKNIAGAQQSIVYFGTYPQSSDGRGGYNTEPIKWRVLQNADGKLFILSDKNIEAFIYGKNGAEAKWSESELRKWLNGISSYSGGGFSAGAFTEKELSAIADTKLKNDDNTQVTVGSPDTTDSVFVLSITEAMNPSFGFDGDFKADGSRISINTDYASAGGAMKTEYGSTLRGPGEANYWWLRSPGSGISCAAHVTDTGYVDDSGIVLTANDVAVRPALNVDLSKVLFTSLAKGGKGGDEYSPDEWKLTLLDESRKDFAVSETAAESYPGGTVWLTFSGAAEGDNEYVSVIVCDKKGNPVYYGSVKTGVKEGRAGFTLPGDLPAGSYTMKAFSEQNNGDYMTDLASPFCSVALKVSKVYLWIGGEAVTSAHTSGEGWRFDAEKNTLYLDKYSYEGAGYEYTDEDGDTRSCGVYYNGKEVLTVSLTGENKITQVPNGEVDGSIGFYSTEYSADVTFTGGGSLTASSGKAKIGSDGIVIMGGMTVGNDTSVCAEGSADALFSIGVYAYNSLTVNGTLTASGGTQALLNPYTPAEGVAAWGSKAGEDDKEEYNKGDNDSYKWFRAEPETSCSLWVGGEEVTTAHASGEGWRFNPFTNTLYLENYTYEGAGNEFKLYDFTLGCGVCYVGEKALTVSLTGENKITQVPNGRVDSSTGFYSLESDTDVTFTGGGSLTASSGTAVMENSGININGGITVGKDTSVCAAASANDKRSYGVSTGEKTTVNGTLTASGGTRAFLNLYTPTEGVTAWGSKAGEDDKEEYNKDDNDSYKWFRAEYTGKSYNLWIGGEAVTSAHTSGEGWRFDADKNTLYLENYTYEGAGYEYTDTVGDSFGCGVYYNGEKALTVSLTGENTIKQIPNGEVDGSIGFYSTESGTDVTFTGGGSLTVSSGKAKIESDGIVIMGGITVGKDTSVCAEGSADAELSYGAVIPAYRLTVNGTLTASGATCALINTYTPAEGVEAWGSKAGEDDKEEYNKGDNDSYKWFRAEYTAESYNLWIGGEEVTTAHTSGEGWRFDADKNTLYLENYTYEGAGYEYTDTVGSTFGCGVCYNGKKALTVSLTGENTIKQIPNGEVDESVGFDSGVSGMDVTFTGGGSLTVSGGAARDASVGIDTIGNITIDKGTSVCAEGSADAKQSYGAATAYRLTVNGTLTASGATCALINTYTPAEGVEAWGSETDENGKVEYNKGDNWAYKWFRAEYTAESHNLWVGGEEVTTAHTSGENWRFDAEKNTLYLDKYSYEGAGYEYTDTVGR
ncbi:MAG: hypothetical protein IKD89_08365, partial [Clostridia bacterium]|nr:hypothetical protein [Clostridia bacterium]